MLQLFVVYFCVLMVDGKWASVLMHVDIRGPLWVLFFLGIIYFLSETGPLTGLKVHQLTELADQGPFRLCLPCHRHWGHEREPLRLALYTGSGDPNTWG